MNLSVFRAKKYPTDEFAGLAWLVPDHSPAGGKTHRAGFIDARNSKTNGHHETLSPRPKLSPTL